MRRPGRSRRPRIPAGGPPATAAKPLPGRPGCALAPAPVPSHPPPAARPAPASSRRSSPPRRLARSCPIPPAVEAFLFPEPRPRPLGRAQQALARRVGRLHRRLAGRVERPVPSRGQRRVAVLDIDRALLAGARVGIPVDPSPAGTASTTPASSAMASDTVPRPRNPRPAHVLPSRHPHRRIVPYPLSQCCLSTFDHAARPGDPPAPHTPARRPRAA